MELTDKQRKAYYALGLLNYIDALGSSDLAAFNQGLARLPKNERVRANALTYKIEATLRNLPDEEQTNDILTLAEELMKE